MKKWRIAVLIALGLVTLLSVFLAASCFDTALRAGELYPWLISQGEPGAEGAMMTLEEKQFQWALVGGVYLIPGLCAIVGGVWLLMRGKREGNT